MNSPEARGEVLGYVDQGLRQKVSLKTLCLFLEITPRTIQNWKKIGELDRRKGSEREVAHRLSDEEEELFYAVANEKRFADSKPNDIVAILLQEKRYIASPSTLYRILAKRKALQHRREGKKPIASKGPQYIDVTDPNQVWAWDITWLRTDVRGKFWYAYNILDVRDRTRVGWSIEDHESEDLAHKLFTRVLRDTPAAPLFIHADNGNPMRGSTLGAFLDHLGVKRSHSRPRRSNDNPFIESYHRTMKYTVGYPDIFPTIDGAREWYADFINGYNYRHLHSGLDYVTPMQARTGEANRIYEIRNFTLAEARAANPGRWRRNKTKVYSHPLVKSFCRVIEAAA